MIIYSNYFSKVNLKSEKYVYYYFSQMIHLLPAPKIKIIIHKDKLIKLQIWDTAGQERFRTKTKKYNKGAHDIILTYDVNEQNSFKNIRNWIKQIEANAQTNVCKVLVGNKCDKSDRVVTEEEGVK